MQRKTPSAGELRYIYNGIFDGRPRGQNRNPRDENHTRMDRALSWLERYERAIGGNGHLDERFLFLWIAFNAAYGDDEHMKVATDPGNVDEYHKINCFLQKIAVRDNTYRLADIVSEHGEAFLSIIGNRFLCNSFWKAEYPPRSRNAWKGSFEYEKKEAQEILRDEHLTTVQTKRILHLAFSRLYTLRNQVLHGSASWRDNYNRGSLESGDTILGLFVPEALRIMLDAIKHDPDMPYWGQNAYPPYLDKPDDTTKGPPPRTPKKGK